MPACLPWPHTELGRIRPALVVCPGATAAKAVPGGAFKVTERRGRVERLGDCDVIAASHPSAVLRAPDRDEAYRGFPADPKVVPEHLGEQASPR